MQNRTTNVFSKLGQRAEYDSEMYLPAVFVILVAAAG